MVGRACDYVLKERKNVVKIFIHAPFEYKVNKVMEMYHDDKEKAETFVKRSDSARANYYKSVSGHEWGDSDMYDLSINSSIGVEEAANVIISYINSVKKAAWWEIGNINTGSYNSPIQNIVKEKRIMKMTRREFLKMAAASTLGLVAASNMPI